MEFLHGLALVLLTLVGYSSGCVLGGRDRKIRPGLLDIFIVLLLWTAALVSRGGMGRWLAVLVWFLAGMAVGALFIALRRNRWPAAEVTVTPPVFGNLLRQAWERWKAFAAEMGEFQSRILLIMFYFVVVTPFGLATRLFSDPLRSRAKSQSSFWVDRPAASATLEEGRNQF
jgi:hypothetical protein